MRRKISVTIATVAIAFAVVIWFAAPPLTHLWIPVMPPYRHVDPSAEAERPPFPTFLALLVTGIFDSLIKGDYAATAERLKTLGATYIPEGLRFLINRFMRLMNDVANLLNDAEGLMDQAEGLITIGRGGDAEPLLSGASRTLASANVKYNELKKASEELTGAFSLPGGNIYAKVDELGRLIEGLYERLQRLLNIIEKQISLEETFLQIDVEPKNVWTGGNVEVHGKLYTSNGSLGGKIVQVLVDGEEVAETVSLEEGEFNAAVSLPYIYKPEVDFQARYAPQGLDSETYRPAASNVVGVSLLYIKPIIGIETIREVLPGKPFNLKGYVEADVLVPYSNLKVSWAGASLTASLENGRFEAVLYTPGNIPDGEYVLTVEAPAWQVFAPARATVEISVQRLPINVTLQIPHVIFAGLTSTMDGRIEYGNEQFNVAVKVVFAGQAYATNSSGEFKVRLTPPLTILTGYQNYEVHVTPDLPWYSSLTLKGSILTVNPLTILVPIGLFSAIALKVSKGVEKTWRQKLEGGFEEETPRPISRTAYSVAPDLEWLIDLYWQACAIISGMTGVEMKPYMTLREYLKDVRSKIGNLHLSFETLTLATEKALYSPSVPTEDLESAKRAVMELKASYVEAEL